MTTIINTGEAPGSKSRRRLAEMLYKQGTGNEPIQHWMQGVARLAQAGIGGYQMHQLDQEERDRDSEAVKLLMGAPGLQQPTVAQPSAPAAPVTGPVRAPMREDVPVSSVTPSAGAVPAALGARPGAPVMPTAKVWGDHEAEAAGLYEPSTRVASAAPQAVAQSAPAVTPQPVPAVAPPVTQAGGAIPLDQANYIRKLMANPATRDYGAALYQKAMTEQAAAMKPTDEIREFEYARRNPAFKDYKTDLKRAGAITNQVMIDQKGEGEFSKEGGKLQAKRFNELAEEGPTAKQMVSDIDTLRTLGSQIDVGKGAEAKAKFGPYAESLGIKVDGLSEIQAYEAIVNRLAPTLRVKGSGAQSDYELRGFLKSLPSLGNTPGGNEITSQVLQGLAENKIRAAEIGAAALNGKISRPDAEKMLRDLPDPMSGYREFIKKMKPAAAKAQTDIRQKYGLE